MNKKNDLADLLKWNEVSELVTVLRPESWSNEFGPKDWWSVCDEGACSSGHGGIIAYFFDETDAIAFRHDYIKLKVQELTK